MSSQEYYEDNKYPNHGNQSPMPPYSQYPPYSAYPGASNPNIPPGHSTGYSPQNGYQYQPQDYYGEYQQQQQPPPPYYQHQHQQPAASVTGQPPYPYSYPPPQSEYPTDAAPGTEAPNDRGALGAIAGGAAGARAPSAPRRSRDHWRRNNRFASRRCNEAQKPGEEG